jgi:hypothetical protein
MAADRELAACGFLPDLDVAAAVAYHQWPTYPTSFKSFVAGSRGYLDGLAKLPPASRHDPGVVAIELHAYDVITPLCSTSRRAELENAMARDAHPEAVLDKALAQVPAVLSACHASQFDRNRVAMLARPVENAKEGKEFIADMKRTMVKACKGRGPSASVSFTASIRLGSDYEVDAECRDPERLTFKSLDP